MWSLVALLTDYGYVDTYVAEVKARILSYRRDVQIVDVTHGVASFNELEAAFLLRNASRSFPDGTIFICIIDPKVGTGRRSIIIKTRRGKLFIGPDTGFMIPAAKEHEIENVWVIDENKLPGRISETFHGRDVFAEAAGRILAGEEIENMSYEVDGYEVMELPRPRVRDGRIEAMVMHVDKFGNIITNIHAGDYGFEGLFGSRLRVRLGRSGKTLTAPLVKSYGAVKKGSPLLTVGGSGYVELSVNMGDASKRYRVKPGDKIVVEIGRLNVYQT